MLYLLVVFTIIAQLFYFVNKVKGGDHPPSLLG